VGLNSVWLRYYGLLSWGGVGSSEVIHGYLVFVWNFPWVHKCAVGYVMLRQQEVPCVIKD